MSVKVTFTLKLLAIMVLAGIEPTFFAILPVFTIFTIVIWLYVRRTGAVLTWYLMQVFQNIMFALIAFYGFNTIAALLGTVSFFILFVLPLNILKRESIWQEPSYPSTTLPTRWEPPKNDETKVYDAEVVDD